MACGMLKAIGNFLNSEIDEVVSRMFVYPDSTSSDEETLIKYETRLQTAHTSRTCTASPSFHLETWKIGCLCPSPFVPVYAHVRRDT